jgi:hypothetical protein
VIERLDKLIKKTERGTKEETVRNHGSEREREI